MAKIFFSDIQSVTLNYHTPSPIGIRSVGILGVCRYGDDEDDHDSVDHDDRDGEDTLPASLALSASR